ncbi:hypothetical protein BASA62_003414 [Batrachochytrium salamandrivorans]|nr:hypothetical protein BASA62_003414 [Batrachochytrium salamandrivorans]
MFKLDDKVDGSVYTHVFGYDAGGQYVGAVPISPPNELPPVEANQTDLTFSTEHYSATLPAAWIVPYFGLAIGTQSTPAACCTTDRTIFSEVSSDNELDIYTLPTYLYGADEINFNPLEKTMGVPLKNQQEFWAKQPASKINFRPPSYWSVKVSLGGSWSNKYQALLEFTYGSIAGGRWVLYHGTRAWACCRIPRHNAHGQTRSITVQCKRLKMASLWALVEDWVGGVAPLEIQRGLVSFIHEVGHGMGLPHAGGCLPQQLPRTSKARCSFQSGDTTRFAKCFYQTLFHQPPRSMTVARLRTLTTADSRASSRTTCKAVSGDQAKGDIFTMASDYNAAKIKNMWIRARFPTPSHPRGIRLGTRLESIDRRQAHDAGQRLTTAAVRKFYPLNNAYTGNLMRYIDPTNSTALDELKKKAVWYCRVSGCDYTFKMTYTDGSVIYQLHQGGFRKWFKVIFDDGANDPLDGGSFRSFYHELPRGQEGQQGRDAGHSMVLTNGFPASPAVLMSYVYP